ncbi:NAD(P)-dependent oxidoreductase [Microbacterium sp. GXF7504]
MTALFIGLGMMGEPMARNLAGAVDLALYDVNADAAARLGEELGVPVLDGLDPLPDHIDTVILMVPNSRIVESLVRTDTALLERLPAGSLIIDMSSSEPESTRTLAAAAAQHGIDYVDAPVSGGVAKAKTGELAIMVGATEPGFERARPYLEVLGASIHHVGDPGAGDAAKALNNLLSATNIAAAAEVITAAARFGIAPEKMVAVLNASTGRSQATEVKYPNFILSGTFASGFGMDLMLKDLAIARSLTSGAGLVTPVTDSAGTVAERSRAVAGSPPDHTEIARYYETSNDVLIRR